MIALCSTLWLFWLVGFFSSTLAKINLKIDTLANLAASCKGVSPDLFVGFLFNEHWFKVIYQGALTTVWVRGNKF